VDARQKSFVSEVAERFRFLVDEKGFIAVPSGEQTRDSSRPRALNAVYLTGTARVEVSLALAHAGEDVVITVSSPWRTVESLDRTLRTRVTRCEGHLMSRWLNFGPFWTDSQELRVRTRSDARGAAGAPSGFSYASEMVPRYP
jgi:hypothetical protein